MHMHYFIQTVSRDLSNKFRVSSQRFLAASLSMARNGKKLPAGDVKAATKKTTND